MTDHNAFPSIVSGQEATFTKIGPLIKDAPFTRLTEQEVASMRTFLDPNDSEIADDEVFFYMPNTTGPKDIEGDNFTQTPNRNDPNNDYKQPSAAAGKYESQGRRANNVLAIGDRGVLESVHEPEPGARVLWNAVTPSPAGLQLVDVELV